MCTVMFKCITATTLSNADVALNALDTVKLDACAANNHSLAFFATAVCWKPSSGMVLLLEPAHTGNCVLNGQAA